MISPSVSTEDVIHIKVHTYRSSYKEIKHTHHTAFRWDYKKQDKVCIIIIITTFLYKHIVSILKEKSKTGDLGRPKKNK